jgi:hypothetical protein
MYYEKECIRISSRALLEEIFIVLFQLIARAFYEHENNSSVKISTK